MELESLQCKQGKMTVVSKCLAGGLAIIHTMLLLVC